MTHEYSQERLLYVLSARKEMSWNSWKETFDALCLVQHRQEGSTGTSGSKYDRNATARSLDSLGHCELDFSGNGRVAVAAPVLTRLPQAGLPQAVLCGARSPETVVQLQELCNETGGRLTESDQHASIPLLPRRIMIEADEVNGLHDVARKAGVRFESDPSAWGLLHFAGTLDSMLDQVKWQTESPLNWWAKIFDPKELQWGSLERLPAPNTTLLRYIHPRRQIKLHMLVREGRSAEIDLDWGRYAAIRDAGMNVIIYDDRRYRLAVPQSAPLPRILARSLGLCSGYAPSFLTREEATWANTGDYGYHVYSRIPPQIAHSIAARLGQQIVKRTIN